MIANSDSAESRAVSRYCAVPAKVSVQHQVDHAEDRIHGRADLVTHVGQECALGAAGRFGRLHGLPQGGLHFFPRGDVDADAEDGRFPVVLDDGRREIGPQLLALLGQDLDFVAGRHVLTALAGHGVLQDQLSETRDERSPENYGATALRGCSRSSSRRPD